MTDNPIINDGVEVKGLGWAMRHFYRSSAVSPLLSFSLIVSFFAIPTVIFTPLDWMAKFWATLISAILLIFIVILIKNPNLMRSEEYNLDLRKLEARLGHMNKPLQVESAQAVFQPVRKTQSVSTKANIVKS